MAAGKARSEIPPPGGIGWYDVADDGAEEPSTGLRGGPLGLRIVPLRAGRSPFAFRGARMRGTRCFLSASTVSGAEVSRPARTIPGSRVTAIHLLIRGESSASVFDPGATLGGAILMVIDPAAAVSEQFHGAGHLITLNAHVPLLGMEAKAAAAMCGQSFAMTPFQVALVRASVGLLLADTAGLGSASSLVGLDRHLGSLAGLLLRTASASSPQDQRSASLRRRIEMIIDERARDPQLTPSEVAAALGVSLRQLYRAFAGPESPAALIRRRRLEHAADLLASRRTIGSVEEIAQQSGFESAEYFSRAFRREFGLSPRSYRSAHRDAPSGRPPR
ncbi:MAG: AraC family transcriptional regulator [Jatrophihabitans sp.]|nr:MAG: AraC family transcriptional regulator [Jatrophihabitans sp.]